MNTISGRGAESCELRGHCQTVLMKDLPKRWLMGGELLVLLLRFIYLWWLCVWVRGCTCAWASRWRWGNNFWALSLFFHDGIQGSKLGSQFCMAKGEPYHQHLRGASHFRERKQLSFWWVVWRVPGCTAGIEVVKHVHIKCSGSERRLGKGIRTDVRCTEARFSSPQQG